MLLFLPVIAIIAVLLFLGSRPQDKPTRPEDTEMYYDNMRLDLSDGYDDPPDILEDPLDFENHNNTDDI